MKSIAAIAVAGLAAAATAGSSINIHFDADRSEAVVGETITWSVVASFTGYGPTAYFGGFVGEFVASDAGLAVSQNAQSFMAGNATPPQTGVDAGVTGINVFNAALLGTNNAANPFTFFSFETVASAEGILDYAADGVVSQFADSGIFTLPVEFDGLSVSTSDRVSIVPAPGAFALLGMGGLAAARRRR